VSAFNTRYGPTALITGSARGIGAGFARALTDRGLEIVLTDVDEDGLNRTARQLRDRSARSVETIPLDMAAPGAAHALAERTAQRDVGLVICNHLMSGGRWQFLDSDVDLVHRQIDANVGAYVDLAHVFGNRLRQRQRGGLILMSSLTAVVGSPYVTTYGAAKAYILAFGSGLGYELRRSGVDVLTLVPSSVNTEAYRQAERSRSRAFPPMEVEDFAEQALRSLGKRWVAVPGLRNHVTATVLARVLPRQFATALMGRNMEKMIGAG
jgi:short-subunit dehydrogenase